MNSHYFIVTPYGMVEISDKAAEAAGFCQKPDLRTRQGKKQALIQREMEDGMELLYRAAARLEMDSPLEIFAT